MIALYLLFSCTKGTLGGVPDVGVIDTGQTTLDTPPPDDTEPGGPVDTAPEPPRPTGDTAALTTETGDTAVAPVVVVPPTPDVIVDCTGGGDFLTIQAAIDASVSGNVIGVQPCTYTELIDYRGKSLDIYALDGPATTILDGAGAGPLVTLTRGESDGTRLAGFTLTSGKVASGASAIRVEYARATLEGLVITGNLRSLSAISMLGAFVDIIDTTVTGNVYENDDAAAISAETGTLLLSRVTATCDGAEEALYAHNAVIVLDSTLTCDGGYAAYIESGEIHARRSRLEGTGEGALYASDNPDNLSERATLSNVEVVGGRQGAFLQYMNVDVQFSTFVATGEALALDACRDTSEVQNSLFVGGNCDVQGDGTPYEIEWNGVDDLCNVLGAFLTQGDPLFVASPLDLHLQVGSPMIDAADPGYTDPDGTPADLGRWGGPEADGPP